MNTSEAIERHYCSEEACGDCAYYKYFSGVWACHYTLDTGIIRKGPITPECPYKRIATPEELKEIKRQARQIRAQAKR
ncbi:MAG: hypothetical protein E7591_00865 [Ruminococcaceae bacterium]|nr:hypothetical protein [Oscillospiraceae bacterium]